MRAHIMALLLDRDGTVIQDKHYLSDPEGVELLPGVAETLRELGGQGVRLFLVSNQSGVGRGYFDRESVLACNQRLRSLLQAHGVVLADSVFCPHAPEEECACRKPRPGMWEALRRAHGLDPAQCLMVGDKPEDMAFAQRAGLAGAILALTGKGENTLHRFGLEGLAADVRKDGVAPVPSLPPGSDRPGAVIADFSALPRAVGMLEQGLALALKEEDRRTSRP